MRRAGLFVALGLLGLGAECRGLTAQLRMEGSVTGALAWERYGGTFAVLTVPLVDSTEHVFAGASEWDFSGNLSVTRPRRSLNVTADGGLRQLVAGGFLQRNYAPRALNFKVQTRYQELLAAGTLTLGATVDTRSIGRPPADATIPSAGLSLLFRVCRLFQSGYQLHRGRCGHCR